MKRKLDMNKFATIVSTVGAYILAGSASASALTITDLYGDKDGFGISIVDGYTQPTWPKPVIVADDLEDIGTITDTKLKSDKAWSQTFDLSGLSSIASISLEIMTYGQGYKGKSSLYLDNIFIGKLTDGDTSSHKKPKNMARLDIFDLTSFAGSLLDGASTCRIDTVRNDDWWYLDYSELTITGAAASVSEPSSLALLGLSLAGLGWTRKKDKA
jgi:hypothetical protein